MKVVFDTNVFISALIVSGGHGEAAFLLARRQQCDLYTSVAILTEVAQKLRDKFGQSDGDIALALRLLSRAATIVRPGTRLRILEDEPDNRILECAAEAHADVIVSGDRHLLRLRTFGNTAILRLADFLRLFEQGLPHS